jgi:hypothetical protein
VPTLRKSGEGQRGAEDIKVYPEASHGFLNDHPPEDITPVTVLLSKLSGTRYHERRPRTLAAASSPSLTPT